MMKAKPFRDSDFVVAWSGESPDSQILHGFDAVVQSIATDTGLEVEEVEKSLANSDQWLPTQDGGDDSRHIFHHHEYVYCCSIWIIRILR